MANGIVNVPVPRNEPGLDYRAGSPERVALRARLAEMSAKSSFPWRGSSIMRANMTSFVASAPSALP